MRTSKQTNRLIPLFVSALLALTACGGGGSDTPSVKNQAIEKITAYAADGSNTTPSLQDYIDAGVIGVTSDNLAELNSVVDGLEAADVDTTEELDALTAQLGINIKPNANAGEDKTVQVNQSIKLTGIATDSDGTVIDYEWKVGSTILATTASFNYTPTSVGTDTLTFTVTDNDGDSASDTVDIVIIAVPVTNQAPTANAGADKTVEVNQSITITGSGADSDGSISGYEWTKGSTVLVSTASFTYTPTTVGADTLTLTVTDNTGATATDSIIVNVTEVAVIDATPPVITILGENPATQQQGETYTDAGATAIDDVDGNVTVYTSGSVNTSTGGIYTITYTATDSSGNTSTDTRTVNVTATKITISGKAVNGPIVGGNVVIKDLSGITIGSGVTGEDGSYSIQVIESAINDGYEVILTGGQISGIDFNDELSSIYSIEDSKEKANISLLTTLVGKLSKEESTGSLLEKRERVIQKLSDMGMLKKLDWFENQPSFVDMNELQAIVISNEVNSWIDGAILDLADSQLGLDKMSIFNMAHGGLYKASIYPNEFISIFPGQVQIISIAPEFTNVSDNTIDLEKLDGPEWVSIQNGKLHISPPANLTTYGNYISNIEITANGVSIGRTKSLKISLLKKVILLYGELDSSGGTIENQWRDISISVDSGKLSQNYQIEYNGGISTDGRLSLWLITTPVMSPQELAELDVIQPSFGIIKANYLQNNETATQSRPLRQSARNVNEYSVFVSNGVPEECRPGTVEGLIVDEVINEMVWTDENNDGMTLPYVWQGNLGLFDFQTDFSVEDIFSTGGLPRVQVNKATSGDVYCASALRSKVSDSTDISDKTAVLFVHGFISSGKLGGYDQSGLRDGSEYFDRFPDYIDDKEINGQNLLPFVFQWRTNAKFEDVASELGKAINELSEKTGKKIHIIAHSFGGILTRTLVQGLATSTLYDNSFSEKNIATITTVGTPHSGTFGSRTEVDFDGEGIVTFPEGRNGAAGGGIELCRAITCYQTGTTTETNIGLTTDTGVGNNALYGTKAKPGYISYKTFKSINDYPNIPTQVLIGLVPESVTAERTGEDEYKIIYDFLDDEATVNPGAGDKLISIFGQRVIPTDNQNILDTMYSANNIEEHILQMDTSTSNFLRGSDDNLVLDYRTGLLVNDDWTKDNYREGLTYNDLRYRFSSGYNHRTGKYSFKTNEITDPHNATEKVTMVNKTLTEVGLHDCSYSTCNHPTWNYFKTFIEEYEAELINPIETIRAQGQVSNGQSTLTDLPISVYLYVDGENIGELSQEQNGEFVLEEATFIPNAEYKLSIVPDINSGLLFRGGYSAPITTGETLEESSLNFPVFELVSTVFAEGELGVVLKDGASGVILSDYTVEIINYEDRTLETMQISSASETFNLPAGRYLVNVTKIGYESSIPQDCQVEANTSTFCNISLLPSGHIAEGTLTAVLTWQVNPSDLDSHLIKYDVSGNELYHIYYRLRSDSMTGDNLDVDDTSSYGPETVTIQDVDDTARYVYAIYHYGGSGSISTTSSAVVNVQTSSATRTYNAPTSGTGRWWKVFEVNGGRIIPCQSNCLFNSQSEVVSARQLRYMPSMTTSPQEPLWLSDLLKDGMPSK